MVITLQQSVQVPQRLPSMTTAVISIHSPWEKAAPVSALGAIKPSDYVGVARVRGKHGDPESAEPPNVRWVVLHVIEEIARHCGHLDVGRELLDGMTRLGQGHSERPASEAQSAP